jgi:hypothetical protein
MDAPRSSVSQKGNKKYVKIHKKVNVAADILIYVRCIDIRPI